MSNETIITVIGNLTGDYGLPIITRSGIGPNLTPNA